MRHRKADTRLYKAMDAAGVSVATVAAHLGLHRITVHAMAAERQPIPTKHVGALAELLGVTKPEIEAMSRTPIPIIARASLRQRGLTVDELQPLLGLDRGRLTMGLSGFRELPRSAQLRLAELLDMPVEQVMAPDLNALDELLDQEVDA